MKKLFIVLSVLFCAATVQCADVTVSWTAPDDARVTGYNVYVSTSLSDIKTTISGTVAAPATSYTVTGLTEGEDYYFGATSRDAQGNESAMSDIIHYTVESPAQVIEVLGRPKSIQINFE